jgi:glycosyltransferase involved in cell wall biosynthesis
VRFFLWLKSERINVLHTHHRRLAMLLCPFGAVMRTRVIYTGQLTYPFSFLFWLTPFSSVTAITESVRQNILATTRCTQVEVIGNPVRFPDDPAIIDLNAVSQRAVCIARLEPVKNHTVLIHAWSKLSANGSQFTLWLVGEGSLRSRLEALVRRLKLEDRVIFCGYHSDVVPVIEQCLFAVLVSTVEGQGIVTVEAAASGRASLLTDVDGSRDCIPPDRTLANGFDPSDVEELEKGLRIWFDQPQLVAEEGKLFFQFHKSINSYEIVGERYAALYRRNLVQNSNSA